MGFIIIDPDEDIELEIKFRGNKLFQQPGDFFNSWAEKFLKYEDAYLKRIAIYD